MVLSTEDASVQPVSLGDSATPPTLRVVLPAHDRPPSVSFRIPPPPADAYPMSSPGPDSVAASHRDYNDAPRQSTPTAVAITEAHGREGVLPCPEPHREVAQGTPAHAIAKHPKHVSNRVMLRKQRAKGTKSQSIHRSDSLENLY